jgi:hypothetical protein
MPGFLLETYETARDADPATLVAERSGRAEALENDEPAGVHLRGVIFVPDDEVCFYLFDGPSAEAVRETALRASIVPPDREVPVKRSFVYPGR